MNPQPAEFITMLPLLQNYYKLLLCNRFSLDEWLGLRPSMSCGAPVEFSLSPGVAPLSLLSVSEVWPVPFLMGSISASPFSSGATCFPSASGLLAGAAAGAEVKAGSRGTGLLLGGADCRAGSPAEGSTGLDSPCVDITKNSDP